MHVGELEMTVISVIITFSKAIFLGFKVSMKQFSIVMDRVKPSQTRKQM